MIEIKVAPDSIKEINDAVYDSDIIIVYNSGGWGHTPPEDAKDFLPILNGIQSTLVSMDYTSNIVPYYRMKEGFAWRIIAGKDFLVSFDNSSEFLAEDLEFLVNNLPPQKKIIITGLSNGGGFTLKTYEKLSEKAKKSVYAIVAGPPFWTGKVESENVLYLTNNGNDSFSGGHIVSLITALVKSPFKMMEAKLKGEKLEFAFAFQTPGHEYDWTSSSVEPEVRKFLEKVVKDI